MSRCKDGPGQDFEQGHSPKQLFQKGRRDSVLAEPRAKRLKASSETGQQEIKVQLSDNREAEEGAGASSVRPGVYSKQGAPPSVNAQAPEDDSGPGSPFDSVIWPPTVVVHNLRTGVLDGKWTGVAEESLQKTLGYRWHFQNVYSNPRKDGHMGAAVLVIKGNREGISAAKGMDAHFKAMGQGRREWGRVLIKSGLPISSRNVEKELSAWLQHVQGLVEENGSRRLFCYLATRENDLRDRGLYRQFPRGRKRSRRWVAISVKEAERRCGESEAATTRKASKHLLPEVVTAGTSQKEVNRKATAVEQIEEQERRLQEMQGASEKDEFLEQLRCLKALHSEELAETWNRAVKESKTTDNAETENLLRRLQQKEARFLKYQDDQHSLNKDLTTKLEAYKVILEEKTKDMAALKEEVRALETQLALAKKEKTRLSRSTSLADVTYASSNGARRHGELLSVVVTPRLALVVQTIT
ncbi:hypothetical protein KFL_000660140 [Klebsormidium nitens]|uniref:XS domain-containing protein n=1 Tax=Klebsormidium nitens TaxID=105231 RepID=A0A1Y1HQL9_KLENI|nr:hypothetical protein KFL_000660140 [Klebsormidium nitens]|eukprot:GAQ80920.1 hypothetical protein KFL_000660140 [Klebsormidium nitens]